MNAREHSSGFPPIKGANPRVLILGSLPGVVSLQKQEYYGNKQNLFWRIMQAVLGIDNEWPYQKRASALIDKGVMLWDVFARAKRTGSLDANIKDATPNDFTFLHANDCTIKCVLCNGGKSYQTLLQLVERANCPPIHKMPSTSPANASMPRAEKIAVWKSALSPHIN